MKKSNLAIFTTLFIITTLQILAFNLGSSHYDPLIDTTYATNLIDVGTLGIDWTLEDILTDSSITFSSFRGKVIILDFFATWCVPCQDSMAEFANVKNSFSSHDLVIISIHSDSATESTLEDFAVDYNMDWKIVIDTANLRNHYEITNIPTIYIFDTDLRIHHRSEGIASASTLSNIINSILDEYKPPATTSRPPGEPLDGFWVKNWYWFGILLVFVVIGSVVFIQRRKVIEHNKKIHAEKIAEKRRKEQKRKRR
ncbi:MAG: TlpA family protein disulfide reductase [Asgard group archaeon]|nr:TlpA family protein disulfide reductase [Asgard group archaeon]